MSKLIIELIGGPPWGFRISQDNEKRPVVGQILIGGRGDAGGLRIGDVITKVGSFTVSTNQEAHSLVNATEGLLSIQVFRDNAKFHQTVRNEKLSSSADNSPSLEKRSTSSVSVPTTPVLPRTNPHHSRNSPRQVRMEMMKGSRNSTDTKRKLFEDIAETNSPSVVDHLLKRKIQMGVKQGPPTTISSIGYDSAAADFAGENSRTSPESSSIAGTSMIDSKVGDDDDEDEEEEDTEQITVVENAAEANNTNSNQMEYYNQNPTPVGYHDPHQHQHPPHQNIGLVDQPSSSSSVHSTPQWNVRTEQRSTMPAQGDIEVPVRRNVAALRQVINDRLEMKTPTGGVSASTPSNMMKTSSHEPEKPAWAANVKVYEPNGFQDPHKDKHNMGRVLDGPVNPSKYFQGVPPPSYSHVPTEAKPPVPPAKPAPPKTSSTIRLPPELSQNSYHQQYQHQSYQPQQIHHFAPKHHQPPSSYHQQRQFDIGGYTSPGYPPYGLEDMDDGASMISSCISTFGDSSEVAAYSAAGAQRNLYDQYKRGLLNPQQRDDLTATPTRPTVPTIPEEMSNSMSASMTGSINEKSDAGIFADVPLTPFGQAQAQAQAPPKLSSSLFDADIQLTPFGQSEPPQKAMPSSSSLPNSNLTRSGSRQSLDLESSELLVKSKSPAPYSTSSADHYGTIRKRHTPVKIDLTDSQSQNSPATTGSMFSFSSPPPARVDHRSCDSGYEGSNAISPEQTSSRLEKALSDAFDLASSLASSMNITGIDGSETAESRRPDSFMSSSTFDAAVQPSSTPSGAATAAAAAAAPIHPSSSPPHTPRLLGQQQAQAAPPPPSQAVSTQLTPNFSSAAAPPHQQHLGALPTSSPSPSSSSFVSPTVATGAAAPNILEIDPEDQMYPKRHFHAQTEPEMSLWYKKMFKQMHKPGDLEEAQPHLQNQNHNSQNLKEQLDLAQDQTAHISRQPQRVEVDIEPRRARSVGRVITPGEDSEEAGVATTQNNGSPLATPNLFALERSKTPHFHLPSYKFRDEDPRPIRCSFGGCSRSVREDEKEKATFGTVCMVCRRPRKDESFADVAKLYEEMEKDRKQQSKKEQKRMELRQVADKLDETTKELDVFIQQLEQTWQRSKSQPVIRVQLTDSKSQDSEFNARTKHLPNVLDKSLAAQIEELKRLSKEEDLVRQKAEKLTDELQKEKDRRHNYIPSAAPSLQNNMDRFDTLMRDYSVRREKSPMRLNEEDSYSQAGRPSIVTATVVYKFDARSPRELALNRGDIVRIIREVDSHWLEGERNGRSGIFPASYVQIESEFDRSRQKMRAFYPFTARNSNELNLKKGEIVTFRREIDMNWVEGSNQIGQIGIFPSSYVRMLSDPPVEAPTAIIPDRPKTPKISTPGDSGQEAPVSHFHQSQSHSQAQNHRVRFEEPKLENNFVEEPIQTNLAQTSHNNHHQSFEKPIDRLNEWGSRKYASNPSDEWAAQDRIMEQVRKPAAHQYHQQQQQPHQQQQQQQQQHHQEFERPSDLRANPAAVIPKGSEVFRAMFAYRPQKEDELELFVNDIIFVVEKCDDGWFIGTSLRTGDFGIFPGNYVQRH